MKEITRKQVSALAISKKRRWVFKRGTHWAKIPKEKGREERRPDLKSRLSYQDWYMGPPNGLAFSGIKPIVGRGKPRPPFSLLLSFGWAKESKERKPWLYGYTWISSTFVANHRWNNGIKQAFNFA